MIKNYISKKKDSLTTNIFVITNLYTLVSNDDQIESFGKFLNKENKNILIYDYFESGYEPSVYTIKKIKSLSYLNNFMQSSEIKNFLKILKIILKIIFSKKRFNLYIDSCNSSHRLDKGGLYNNLMYLNILLKD